MTSLCLRRRQNFFCKKTVRNLFAVILTIGLEIKFFMYICKTNKKVFFNIYKYKINSYAEI